MVVGNDIQCPLALPYQWGCSFSSLKSFQSHMTIRTNTDVFLYSSIHLDFVNKGQDTIHFGPETAANLPKEILS
jgi:hypothetical protein